MADNDEPTTDTPEREQLANLIREVRQCLASAENALHPLYPDQPDAAQRLHQEIERLTRMLRAWHEIDGSSEELSARMHFTEGVTFFAQTSEPEDAAAQKVMARMLMVAPRYAERIDLGSTQKAIEKYRKNNRFDWPSMVTAWGLSHIDPERWRADWKRVRHGRGDLN